MNYFGEINWFAVQAKPWREKLAVSHVTSLGLDVFFPEAQTRAGGGVPGWVVKPLFPGYFFARFSPSIWLDVVRYGRGVLRVVGAGRTPIPVGEEVVDSLRLLLHANGYARLEPRPMLPGDRVKIQQGPLEGICARIEQEWDDGRRVAILLETIQRARVVIDRHCLTHEAA